MSTGVNERVRPDVNRRCRQPVDRSAGSRHAGPPESHAHARPATASVVSICRRRSSDMTEHARSARRAPAAVMALLITALASPALGGDDAQLDRGLAAIRSMTGCYLVDYSYVETASLAPGYVRDARVYDVNRDK